MSSDDQNNDGPSLQGLQNVKYSNPSPSDDEQPAQEKVSTSLATPKIHSSLNVKKVHDFSLIAKKMNAGIKYNCLRTLLKTTETGCLNDW